MIPTPQGGIFGKPEAGTVRTLKIGKNTRYVPQRPSSNISKKWPTKMSEIHGHAQASRGGFRGAPKIKIPPFAAKRRQDYIKGAFD